MIKSQEFGLGRADAPALALIDGCDREHGRRDVVVDFRRPDVIRLGCSPLTTRFVDAWDGV
jgi:hypothetical protein